MPTLRIPLAVQPSNRDATTSKDSRLVNCYVEKAGETPYVVKRPGLVKYSTVTAALGLGIYDWLGDLYEVRGTSLYKNGVSISTVNATGGRYQFVGTGSLTYLVLKNTTNAYYVTTAGVVTAISSANYPTTTVPGVVFLDGYIFVMTPTGEIHNSALEDPITWAALSFITAETEPDGGVALVKQLNYVVALGQWTTEFFFDNATSPGSPLASYSPAFLKIGCASPYSVIQTDGTVVWMSQTREKGREIQALNGFVPTKISTANIERFLNADSLAGVYAYSVKVQGRYFYVLTLTASNLTLVYDFTTQHWHQWSRGATDSYFEGVSYAFHAGTDIIQDEDDGNTYQFLPTIYQDDGVVINTRIVTPPFDGGKNTTKFMSRLVLVGDTIASTIQERHSDDDYQTFSSYRTIDLSTQRKQSYRYGKFRHRSFEFLHTDNSPLRLSSIELDIEEGNT